MHVMYYFTHIFAPHILAQNGLLRVIAALANIFSFGSLIIRVIAVDDCEELLPYPTTCPLRSNLLFLDRYFDLSVSVWIRISSYKPDERTFS